MVQQRYGLLPVLSDQSRARNSRQVPGYQSSSRAASEPWHEQIVRSARRQASANRVKRLQRDEHTDSPVAEYRLHQPAFRQITEKPKQFPSTDAGVGEVYFLRERGVASLFNGSIKTKGT